MQKIIGLSVIGFAFVGIIGSTTVFADDILWERVVFNEEHANAMIGSVKDPSSTPPAPGNQITRFEIVTVESPTFEGRSFGDVGQYEKIFAQAYAEVDPSHSRNALITDISLAPRNEEGMVEYSTDVHIIKPVDMMRSNGRMFYTLNNRGNKGLGTFLEAGNNNPTTAADAGTGWLMEEGYVLVWSGWEDERLRPAGDDRVLARLPVARDTDGSSIVERIVYEHIFDTDSEMEISMVEPGVRDGFKYRAANVDQSQARLRVRNNSSFVGGGLVERVEVPMDAWSYVDEGTVRIDRTHPFLAPYDAGAAFEFTYPARDPVVQGLGFAAVRDVVSFLRHDSSGDNLLRGEIDYALAQGSSQSGRFLRDFIYWGFNEDMESRKVFEGIMPRVAGAHRIALNRRFGDADATGRSYERELTSKMEFPFTYEVRQDSVSGETDGLFARCEISETCPNVMQVDHGNEGWLKALSLVTTDGVGNDIELPDNVRLYFIASAPHGSGSAGSPPRGRAICQQLSNPTYSAPYIRALFLALDEWVTEGTLPPESRYPKVSDGTLAASLPQSSVGFPEIPNVTYTGWHVPVAVKDTTTLPNQWVDGKEYEVLVPTTDVDGNDLAGVRPVEIEVPLGTYTGWALRRAPFAEDEDCATQGQFIPFPVTQAEREAIGDPRRSIEERYTNYEEYRDRVSGTIDELVEDRLILEEDAERLKENVATRWLRLPRR